MTDCTKCDRKVKSSKLLLHYKRSHGCLPPGHEPGSFMCDQCPAELQSRVCFHGYFWLRGQITKVLCF